MGYRKVGIELGGMMRKIHGSIAKLVNDLLPQRHVPFWHDSRHHDYFDGCIRDATQFTRAYRYTAMQAVRAGIVVRGNAWSPTQRIVSLDAGLAEATSRKALMEGVPYKRCKT